METKYPLLHHAISFVLIEGVVNFNGETPLVQDREGFWFEFLRHELDQLG
jgi:hypothetical protein